MPMHPENRKQWDNIFGPEIADEYSKAQVGGLDREEGSDYISENQEKSQRPKHDVDCVFCLMILNNEYMAISHKLNCVVIKPRDPVVLGHVLVVPINHAKDAADDPIGVSMAMVFACELVHGEGYDANIITSIGPEATQTVFHTHIHVVPRKAGDGLKLPWTGQKKEQRIEIYGSPSASDTHVHGDSPGPDGAAMRQRMAERQRHSLVYDDDRINWRG